MTELKSDRATLVIASAGTLLVLAAFTTPLASLTESVRDLGAGPSARAWILSSMSLGLAVALLSAGALADDFGRRRIFVAGAGVVAAASVVCAAAPNGLTLILGRVGQGIGGAAVLACSLAVLGEAYPPGPARLRATGIWGASLGAGIAVGPVLAATGQLVVSWRAAHVLLAVASALLAGFAARGLRESKAEVARAVDVPGVALLAVGLACLLAGLTEGRQGWGRPLVLVLVALGVVGLAAFVGVERREHAMIDLALFARPAFLAATGAALASGLGVIALMSFLPTLIEQGLGRSALTAALLLLGWSVTSVLTALVARRLTVRPQLQFVGGLVVVAAGQAGLGGLHADSPLIRLLPGLIIAGAGSGVLNAALGRQAVASVPQARAGMGSGANNTARYLGSAVGVTIVSVLATSSGVVTGWNQAAVVTAVASLLGAGAVLVCREPAVA